MLDFECLLKRKKEIKLQEKTLKIFAVLFFAVCHGETIGVFGFLTACRGFYLSQELLIVSSMLSTLHPCSGNTKVKKGRASMRFYR